MGAVVGLQDPGFTVIAIAVHTVCFPVPSAAQVTAHSLRARVSFALGVALSTKGCKVALTRLLVNLARRSKGLPCGRTTSSWLHRQIEKFRDKLSHRSIIQTDCHVA